MASAQQIYDAMVAGNQAGLSNEQIVNKLRSDFGVSPTEAVTAYINSRPDLFATTDQIMANVNAGNYTANTSDPKYQARTSLLDYARQFEAPPPDLSNTYFQTDNSGHVSVSPGSQYTPQQVQDAITTSMGQGFSPQDIVKGAYSKGIGVDQLMGALTSLNPGIYGDPTSNAAARDAITKAYSGFANPAPTTPSIPSPSTAAQPYQPSPIDPLLAHGTGGSAGDNGLFGSMYGGYQASPWLYAMADELGRRTQQNLGQAFNGIRSNAVGVGGLGGSRQGVAEGIATRGALDSLQGNLAGLFGQDYANSQNRDLSRYGIDTNAYLTGRGQDMNFYGQQRGQDLQQLGLGANIYDMGVQGGWLPLNGANNIFGTYSGLGSTSGTSSQGGGWPGAVGGGLGTWALGSRAGWW